MEKTYSPLVQSQNMIQMPIHLKFDEVKQTTTMEQEAVIAQEIMAELSIQVASQIIQYCMKQDICWALVINT
ncbi:hypothetical protein [Mucilaginibacter sp. SJ]|uniref:hypothetical protein n=1 Tax=Mucilaginibacter sp. SJ TaxID=3029053 RepID=UPI0023A9A3CC|nr:hypothetical protein [Mucilaginibacter sp. SJ]WEA00677.1 hypothetical protein MusilaSJ_24795 [Mucilaginibacter sp. SJ]